MVEEAVNRGIPYIRLNDQSLVQLGYGVNQKRIQATTTVNTNMISVDIAARLLKDPALYAHAVLTGSIEQAAVGR